MDIATTADVEMLVDRFYGKVRCDALLGPIFNDVAQVDWPSHMATLYSFWETMLLGTGTYQGRAVSEACRAAGGEGALRSLAGAVPRDGGREFFSGPKAEEAKGRGLSTADTFARRMGLQNACSSSDCL